MDNRKMIYLDDAIDAVAEGLKHTFVEYRDVAEKMLNKVPSAQPDVTEEAVKEYCRKRCLTILTNDYFHKLTSAEPDYQEVLGWLLAYHTKSFDLHGRYLPNEVIAWLINDFTHNFIAEMEQDNGCSQVSERKESDV